MREESFETLWKYCISNNRLCPQLVKWYQIFKLLKNTNELDGHGENSEPARPEIIDHNWYDIMPIEKQLQFEKYIKWASDNNQTKEIGEYLRSLPEKDWTHYGEI